MSTILSIIINIIQRIYETFHINGILILLIIIEIPCMYAYYNEKTSEGDYYENYQSTVISGPEHIASENVPERSRSDYDDVIYYNITIQIDNLCSKPLYSLPNYAAFDETNNYSRLKKYDYYDDIADYDTLNAETVLPAGASTTLTYYTDSYFVQGNTISFIPFDTLYDKEDHLKKNNTLTITFP